MSIVAPRAAAAALPQRRAVARPQHRREPQAAHAAVPSLGFTISSGGLPYWEVLLFTDRSLIDPPNAVDAHALELLQQPPGRRAAQGRGERRRRRVPRPLRGAARVRRRGAEADGDLLHGRGVRDVRRQPRRSSRRRPQQLALDAPSVTVSADFTPDTIDRVTRRRAGAAAGGRAGARRAGARAGAATDAGAGAPVAAAPRAHSRAARRAPAPVDPLEDAARGEDGYSYLRVAPVQQPPSLRRRVRRRAAAPPAAWPPPQPGERGRAVGTTTTYDDGYGALRRRLGGHEEGWSEAQEAAFPSRVCPSPRPAH